MTTETTSTPNETPKKSNKKFFWIISIILGLFGLDHYTYNFVGIGAEATVTDSTIVVAPIVDTIITTDAVVVAKVDTTKADTAK